MTEGVSVGSFKNGTNRGGVRGRLGLGDGHALTRTIPGARSGGVSERGQEDENQAAERSPETHAAEPQGADWQAGASVSKRFVISCDLENFTHDQSGNSA